MTEQKENISGKIEEYLNKIITEDDSNKFRIGSSAVYTELSAGEILPVTLRSQDEEKQQPREFEVFELVEREKNIVISGDSGSGKTTTLRWLNVIYSRKHLDNKKYRIPLYVDLNTYNKGAFSEYLKIKAKENGLNESTLKSLLESKENLLILIDGLDLPTSSDNFNPNDEILNFISEYSHCKFVISSRRGFFKAFESRFKIFKLEELTDDKIALFIKKYVGDEKAEEIKEMLLSDGKFTSLFKNPLMLFLGIKVAKEFKDSKTELDNDVFLSSGSKLYEYFISYLIHHHFKIKGKHLHCDEVYIQKAVTDIFFNLQCKNRIVCKYSNALNIASNYSEGCEKKKPEYLLDDVFKIGLLEKKDDTIQFGIHQSFQEYYAAKKLMEFFKDGVDISPVFSHPRWENVVILASDMFDCPDEFIEMMIKLAQKKGISPLESLDGLSELVLASKCAKNASRKIKEELCALIANALDSKFELDKSIAIESLSGFEDTGISLIIRALSNENSDVRWTAANALREIESERAVEALISALNHEDSDVWGTAIATLGEIKSEKAVDALISALNHEKVNMQWSAASMLGKIKSEKAVDALISVLNNEDGFMRTTVVSALGQIKSEKAVDALISTLNHEDRFVQERAAYVLGEIKSEKVVDSLNYEDSNVQGSAANALGQIKSKKTVDSLISALNHEDSNVQESAANALGQIKSEKAVDALISALNHEDGFVQGRAAYVLGEIKSEKAVDSLISILNHEGSEVQERAADALGQICTINNKGQLIKLIKSEDNFSSNTGYNILNKIENDEHSKKELFQHFLENPFNNNLRKYQKKYKNKIQENTSSTFVEKYGLPETSPAEEGKTDAYTGGIVDKFKSVSEPKTIVDYGCGKGKSLCAMNSLPKTALHNISYIGVDIRTEHLFRSELISGKIGFNESLNNLPEFLYPKDFYSRDFSVDYVMMVHTLHEIELKDLVDVIFNISSKLKIGGRIYILDQRELVEPERSYVLWDEQDDFNKLFGDSGFKVHTMFRDTKSGNKLSSIEIEKMENGSFKKENVTQNCVFVYESKRAKILNIRKTRGFNDPDYTSLNEHYCNISEQIDDYNLKSKL